MWQLSVTYNIIVLKEMLHFASMLFHLNFCKIAERHISSLALKLGRIKGVGNMTQSSMTRSQRPSFSLPIKTPYKATQALEYNEDSLLWPPEGVFSFSVVHMVQMMCLFTFVLTSRDNHQNDLGNVQRKKKRKIKFSLAHGFPVVCGSSLKYPNILEWETYQIFSNKIVITCVGLGVF